MTRSALRRSLTVLSVLTVLALPAAAGAQQAQQSPIDIRVGDAVADPYAPRLDVRYRRSVDVVVEYVSRYNPEEETVEIKVPDGAARILLGSTSYELDAVHWHTPSEHLVNGRRSPLEQHLVHRTADGRLLVVGVLIELGDRNAELASVFGDLPREGEEPRTIRGFDLTELLPDNRTSFRYPGSLTTAPFTEGVRWVVLADRLTLSGRQIRAFQALFPEGNAREVQPLNGRVVRIAPR